MKNGKSGSKPCKTPTLSKSPSAIGMRTPKVMASAKKAPGAAQAAKGPTRKALNAPVVKSNSGSRTNASRAGVAIGVSHVVKGPKRLPFGTK